MLKKSQIKEVFELAEYLNTTRPYSHFIKVLDDAKEKGELTRELEDEIKQQAEEELDLIKILPAIGFNNEQCLLLKEKSEEFKKTNPNFPRLNIVIRDKELADNRKLLEIIYKMKIGPREYIDFYKNRSLYGFTKDQLNSTYMRLVTVNTVENEYQIDILPTNFLESLLITYIQYHNFIDSKDKNLKKEVSNFIKNSKMDFDHKLYKDILSKAKELLKL